MMSSPMSLVHEAHYELRYTDLCKKGRGYSFPCDAKGQVDMEVLTERDLVNYLFARALVGKLLTAPKVVARGSA